MSLNQSMNITLGSMKNNQYAMTVVSQNIANMNVKGYHRQRVDFQTNEYTTKCRNVIETIRGMNGAHVSALSDYIDEGAFNDLIDKNSDAEYYNTLADALGELEGISDELGDNGLNKILNEFFTASANLEKYPADMSIRKQFVLSAQNVCEKFNDISKKYDLLQDDKIQSLEMDTSTVNNLLGKLAYANTEHVKNGGSVETQGEINAILGELSKYMDITTDKNSNGTVNLYVNGVSVVQGGNQLYELKADINPNSNNNVVNFSLQSLEDENYVITEGVNQSFKSGSIKAKMEFLNGSDGRFSTVNDMKNALNSAAASFGNALNAIQTYDNGDVFASSITTSPQGDLILEKATNPLFSTKNGGAIDASNIRVNQDIIDDPFKVAAARIDLKNFTDAQGNVDPNWIKAVGNSDNATEFTGVQNAKICSFGGGINNCTLSQFLINNAAQNGTDAADIISKAQHAQDLSDSAAANYNNIVGVNLDEELADMIKYQRSYEASARLFATIDSLISTVINMV